MKVYKDKQFLVFEYENEKTVKYDFATKTPIGISGKPVKDLKSQLSGFTLDELFDSCEDKTYGRFLRYIRDASSRHRYIISNIGTILERVPEYSNLEQIFSAGIESVIDLNRFNYTINQIPKALIKLAKTHKIKLSMQFIDFYNINPDAYYLAYKLEYLSMTDDDIFDMLTECYTTWRYIEETNKCVKWTYFNKLINEYGYTAKALCLYVDEIMTLEAVEDSRDIIKELYDYARMMKQISHKFDKYPRNFLTTHRIACRNYNRMKMEFSEELFKKQIDKSLEFTYKDYKFIYPETTQDIKDEAAQQNNCVASYIDKVINGECHILFMRYKNRLDTSVVTIEVRNNEIVQARGKFNRVITPQEQEAVEKWNEKHKVKEEGKVA